MSKKAKIYTVQFVKGKKTFDFSFPADATAEQFSDLFDAALKDGKAPPLNKISSSNTVIATALVIPSNIRLGGGVKIKAGDVKGFVQALTDLSTDLAEAKGDATEEAGDAVRTELDQETPNEVGAGPGAFDTEIRLSAKVNGTVTPLKRYESKLDGALFAKASLADLLNELRAVRIKLKAKTFVNRVTCQITVGKYATISTPEELDALYDWLVGVEGGKGWPTLKESVSVTAVADATPPLIYPKATVEQTFNLTGFKRHMKSLDGCALGDVIAHEETKRLLDVAVAVIAQQARIISTQSNQAADTASRLDQIAALSVRK